MLGKGVDLIENTFDVIIVYLIVNVIEDAGHLEILCSLTLEANPLRLRLESTTCRRIRRIVRKLLGAFCAVRYSFNTFSISAISELTVEDIEKIRSIIKE